jgi:hypothetical protein
MKLITRLQIVPRPRKRGTFFYFAGSTVFPGFTFTLLYIHFRKGASSLLVLTAGNHGRQCFLSHYSPMNGGIIS